jgi:phage tail protein X
VPLNARTVTKKKATAKGRRLKGVPAPRDLTDSVELADWLELKALSSRDGNASKADLAALITRAGGYDPAKDRDTVESLCLAVFGELETRPSAAAESYPFTVKPPVIRVKANALTKFSAYVFCLSLSAWRWINPTERPDDARQLFEDLSCFAAKNFLGGGALRLASPRAPEISGFQEAIERMCQEVGEGGGYRKAQPPGAKKDDTVDVVAWRHFPDSRYGKLVLFGQCASGGKWAAKRSELQPHAFIGQWIQRPFTVDCVRAFFIPHRLRTDAWEETARKAGIPFDRCRLSYWAHQDGPIPQRHKLEAWARTVIPRQ